MTNNDSLAALIPAAALTPDFARSAITSYLNANPNDTIDDAIDAFADSIIDDLRDCAYPMPDALLDIAEAMTADDIAILHPMLADTIRDLAA